MAKLRTRHSAQHKFKLALEAAKEQKTINELSSQHKVHPNQISQWKSLLLEEGPGLFNGQALGAWLAGRVYDHLGPVPLFLAPAVLLPVVGLLAARRLAQA